MLRRLNLFFLSFVVATGSCLSVHAQDLPATVTDQKTSAVTRTSVTTADFSRVVKTVQELVAKHSSEQVLVVIDIDNTLLAMNQHLGSDQWFNWQSGLLQSDPGSTDLVAKDFDSLLDVQGTLFSLSGMHPPQPELPAHVKTIQESGVTTVVLTSRGPGYRDASERELKSNGYDLAKTALRIDEKRGLFMPFDPERPDAHGLSAQIIESIKGRLSPVTYSNGIYMTAGQHKGYMLRSLLARAIPNNGARHEARAFRAIVFVDDHEKHTTRMHEAFEEFPIDIATFRYSREDGNVSNFHASSKRHVVDDWNRLHDFINGVLVK